MCLRVLESFNSYPNPQNSYGNSYGAHREFLEFSLEQHKELNNYCNSINIEYSTSVWDTISAEEIISLNPKMIKVPSACNNHFEMLKVLRDDYKGDVHISFGMTTHEEEENIVSFFEEKKQAGRLVLFPATWVYVHRGFPPKVRKYICTGWVYAHPGAKL